MSKFYRKSPNVRLETVGGEAILMRTDAPYAFALNDSGVVLWDALDHFEQFDGLKALLQEAHHLTPGIAERCVGSFLDTLVKHGLCSVEDRRLVRKKAEIVTELVGSELILLSRSDRKVHLLNDSGALLWQALDQFNDSVELTRLLAEAWPDKNNSEIEEVVQGFLDRLIGLGLVEEIS